MRTRIAARLGAIALGAAVPVLVVASPALAALKPDDGEVHGPALGAGLTVLLFVVVPIGAFLIIAGLAVLPSALAKPRYRPGAEWDHDPTWLDGPPEAPAISNEATARGGASAEW